MRKNIKARRRRCDGFVWCCALYHYRYINNVTLFDISRATNIPFKMLEAIESANIIPCDGSDLLIANFLNIPVSKLFWCEFN